jgi:hypothetical protein
MWQKSRSLLESRRGHGRGGIGGDQIGNWISALVVGLHGGPLSELEGLGRQNLVDIFWVPQAQDRGNSEYTTVATSQSPVWPWKRKRGSGQKETSSFRKPSGYSMPTNHYPLPNYPLDFMRQSWLSWCPKTSEYLGLDSGRRSMPLAILGSWAQAPQVVRGFSWNWQWE